MVSRTPEDGPLNSTTAREALAAELIGDAELLIERTETLVAQIKEARQTMSSAAKSVTACVPPLTAEMRALANDAQRALIEHTESRARIIAKEVYDEQKVALNDAVMTLFHTEVAPSLKQVTATLEGVVAGVKPQFVLLTKELNDAVDRANHPWVGILSHAFTAAWSSAATAGVLYLIWR